MPDYAPAIVDIVSFLCSRVIFFAVALRIIEEAPVAYRGYWHAVIAFSVLLELRMLWLRQARHQALRLQAHAEQ